MEMVVEPWAQLAGYRSGTDQRGRNTTIAPFMKEPA